MTVRIKHRYRDAGDHLAYRNASVYVFDPRDFINGKPPGNLLGSVELELEDGEIEFDHEPTAAELRDAFPAFHKRHEKKHARRKK